MCGGPRHSSAGAIRLLWRPEKKTPKKFNCPFRWWTSSEQPRSACTKYGGTTKLALTGTCVPTSNPRLLQRGFLVNKMWAKGSTYPPIRDCQPVPIFDCWHFNSSGSSGALTSPCLLNQWIKAKLALDSSDEIHFIFKLSTRSAL